MIYRVRRYFKKPHFQFLDGVAYLFLKRSRSNIFLTLADSKKRVIICKTAGLSCENNLKRTKRSPFIIEQIMKTLIPIINTYKIKNIKLVLRMRINIYYRILIKELEFYGLPVITLEFNKRIPFSLCMRQKKLRRV